MLSKEEMRNARLRAMGVIVPEPGSSNDSRTAPRETLTESSSEQLEKKRYISADDSKPLSQDAMKAIKKLMYEDGGATDEDMLRWYNQGFNFCETPSFGLRQGNGGPCGILAAVQAEILKCALFSNSLDNIGVTSLPSPSSSEVQKMFASACSAILSRAAEGRSNSAEVCVIDCPSLSLSPTSPSSQLVVHRLQSGSEVTRFILDRLELFSSNIGCITFLISLMLSRGLERVAQDMDIASNTLIGPYGHCAQELLNLLLTGAANSNIMDGNISMNGMMVKGICQRSSVGYLTHLESLRYCQAGDFYKVPIFPVWVIGSSSHFTVLFALDRRVNDETESERLLSLAQRAFKSADPEENGFINSDKLKEVLEVLNYDEIVHNEVELARLRGHLQIDGGIILWSGFWENVSRLLTKQTTLDILIGSASGGTDIVVSSNMEINRRERSDSEIAREMQAEIDNSSLIDMDSTHPYHFVPVTNTNTSSNSNSNSNVNSNANNRVRSDSEVARELQAEWDREEYPPSGSPGVSPLGPYPPPHDPIHFESQDTFPSVTTPIQSASKVATTASTPFSPGLRSGMHRHDSFADENAVQHLLYHFNGLEGTGRPARLTPFKLIPRSSQNAIGMSLALGGVSDNTSSGFCSPIEEVLRTRWPGSRMDWMGAPPPSID